MYSHGSSTHVNMCEYETEKIERAIVVLRFFRLLTDKQAINVMGPNYHCTLDLESYPYDIYGPNKRYMHAVKLNILREDGSGGG
jgi:hypothetical protein